MITLIKVPHISFIVLPHWFVPRACYHNAIRLAKELNGTPVDGFVIDSNSGSVIAHRWVRVNNIHTDFIGYGGHTYYSSENELFNSPQTINVLWHKVVDHLNTNFIEELPDTFSC